MALQVISSNYAVEQDGYEDVEIQVNRGGFWERLFDPDPTIPLWQKTKTKIVQRPKYKPALYRMYDNVFVAHPSLVDAIRALSVVDNSDKIFSWK